MTMWYVHPTNQVTNREILRRLAATGDDSAENIKVGQLAEDGKRYDVIQIPYRLLKEMYDATIKKSGGDFAFLPFKAERSDEPLKFVPEFLLEKSPSREVKAALQFMRDKRERGEALP
ncbi:MAG: hypothetical protein WBB68_04595 [Candidatus Moraniibacteriota bacterium]